MENLQKKIQTVLDLYKEKNLTKSESLCKELLTIYPNVIILYNILGLILTDQKKIDEAIKCYEKGIKIKPDYAMIYNNLGIIYETKEDYIKAENYYKKSINLDNKISEPHNNLGNLYKFLNKYSDSINCYKNAIRLNPKFAASHYNLGIAYKTIGKFEDAKNSLKEAIKLNSFFCIAHRNLSELIKYTKSEDHFNILKELYSNPKINNVQKIELSFALGKAYDDVKDYDKAFHHYSNGNELRRKNINFSIEDEKSAFNNIKKIFDHSIFTKFLKSGFCDDTPIFILGMPRSGTTLVEQILSSHPSVFGGDELNFIPDLINKTSDFTVENISNINIKKLEEIGKKYINQVKKLSNNSKRVTDKLPINFKWIGFIKLILPNSKIIHCTRNPKDNCLSIFKNYFVNPQLNFAYNLEEISEFYLLYIDLMKYWKRIFPNFIIEAKYEKIIENPKKEIQSLVKACNLPWNDNCLKFYDNKRPIKTASDTQARKKIYKSSIDVWKNHENNLKIFQKLPSN